LVLWLPLWGGASFSEHQFVRMTTQHQATERLLQERAHLRYALRLQVVCSWTDENERFHTSQGTSRDISANGIFVYCETPPALGTNVVLKVIFPPLEVNSGSELLLRAIGKVVRLEGSGSVAGFAAISDFGTWGRTGS
jgi:PilZ domain